MFSTDRPATEPSRFVRLVRPRPGETVQTLITGERSWTFVHYAFKRSWPCTLYHCWFCKRELTRRLYAYYPALLRHQTPAILELTANAADRLEKLHLPFQDDPIGILTITRPKTRKNAPLDIAWVTPTPAQRDQAEHACKPDVMTAMFKIWNLPEPNGETDTSEYVAKLESIIESVAQAHPR